MAGTTKQIVQLIGMNTRLKTNANKDTGYGPIPGDLHFKDESCFMPLCASGTMDFLVCKFAPKSQRYGTVTLPFGQGCLCHGGLSCEDRCQRLQKIQCKGPVIPFISPSPDVNNQPNNIFVIFYLERRFIMVTPTKKTVQTENLLPYESNNFQTRIEGLTATIQVILTALKFVEKQVNYPTAVRRITTRQLTHVPKPLITLKDNKKENNHGKKTPSGKASGKGKRIA
jgi:hypothetical protein